MSSDPSQQPSISYQNGDALRVIYTLPPTPSPHLDSVLFFTVPKSGTVMLTQLLGRLAPQAGLNLVYIIGELYQLGILRHDIPASTSAIFLPKGYCYGFPGMPEAFEIPLLGQAKTILLVRDPRDMVVSLYYSCLLSHPAPGQSADAVQDRAAVMPGREEAQSMGIDDFITGFVACNPHINYGKILSQYAALAKLPGVRVFRYEDVIYNKQQWATDICAHYGWKISAALLDDAVAQIDVFPDSERPAEHVRQVHPGNYKNKLKPATTRWIEETWADEMGFFGYQRHQPASV